jgi:hypothetical protein
MRRRVVRGKELPQHDMVNISAQPTPDQIPFINRRGRQERQEILEAFSKPLFMVDEFAKIQWIATFSEFLRIQLRFETASS